MVSIADNTISSDGIISVHGNVNTTERIVSKSNSGRVTQPNDAKHKMPAYLDCPTIIDEWRQLAAHHTGKTRERFERLADQLALDRSPVRCRARTVCLLPPPSSTASDQWRMMTSEFAADMAPTEAVALAQRLHRDGMKIGAIGAALAVAGFNRAANGRRYGVRTVRLMLEMAT
jgi:hypothetical protein